MSLTPCTEVGENKGWEGEDSPPSLTFVPSGNWWRSPAGERAGLRGLQERAAGTVGVPKVIGARKIALAGAPLRARPVETRNKVVLKFDAQINIVAPR